MGLQTHDSALWSQYSTGPLTRKPACKKVRMSFCELRKCPAGQWVPPKIPT